jgi:hypothetical protein
MTHPEEILEMARLWLLLALVDARLFLFPLAWNRAWLFSRDKGSGVPPTTARIERAKGCARLIKRVACYRLRRGSACLAIALALRLRLRRIGIGAALVYGARRSPGGGRRVEAHAWLDLGGVVIDPLDTVAGFFPFKKGETKRENDAIIMGDGLEKEREIIHG